MDADHLLEGSIGPILRRAVRQVRKPELVRNVEHGGHVPHADVGVEEKDFGPRLLAQRDGHVHGHRRLADAALRGEDGDHVALAGNRRSAEALGRGPLPRFGGQVATAADEERLETEDERVGRHRLEGKVVGAAAQTIGQVASGADEEQDGNARGVERGCTGQSTPRHPDRSRARQGRSVRRACRPHRTSSPRNRRARALPCSSRIRLRWRGGWWVAPLPFLTRCSSVRIGPVTVCASLRPRRKASNGTAARWGPPR